MSSELKENDLNTAERTPSVRFERQTRGSFREGLSDGLPICLGYLSVAFAFGIFATGKGLTVLETVMISMFNVTSAGQLAAVPIIASLGSFIELAVTQLVINLRYALMSISLSQKLDGSVRLPDRFVISFVNTDEVFAVAASKKGAVGRRYLYGLIIPPFLGWSAGTLIGAAAGNILPEIVISSLGIAIYGMFIAIIVPPSKKDRPTLMCVLIAALLGCAFEYLPLLREVSGGFAVIISSVIAAGALAIAASISDDDGREGETDA